jgi:hypothetical protein
MMEAKNCRMKNLNIGAKGQHRKGGCPYSAYRDCIRMGGIYNARENGQAESY